MFVPDWRNVPPLFTDRLGRRSIGWKWKSERWDGNLMRQALWCVHERPILIACCRLSSPSGRRARHVKREAKKMKSAVGGSWQGTRLSIKVPHFFNRLSSIIIQLVLSRSLNNAIAWHRCARVCPSPVRLRVCVRGRLRRWRPLVTQTNGGGGKRSWKVFRTPWWRWCITLTFDDQNLGNPRNLVGVSTAILRPRQPKTYPPAPST